MRSSSTSTSGRSRLRSPIAASSRSSTRTCSRRARSMPVMDWVMTAYDGRVKWLFKHFPLSIHPNAMLAHQAAAAAGEQGRFWAMHDALFADQKNVKREALLAAAQRLGLDAARF